MTAHVQALVLNADYRPLSLFPLSVWSWEDAIKAVYRDKAVVVAEYDEVARSPSVTMRIPSVIALRHYQKPDAIVPFTRYNVFLRDRFTCQYCGDRHLRGLTFDHVVPRCRGGETTWTNIVAACVRCNNVKGNRTDMKPARPPRRPSRADLFRAGMDYPTGYLHESWIDFLYWDAELER